MIYLTGAPATGKSTVSEQIRERVDKCSVFSYGSELTAICRQRHGNHVEQDDLRRRSADMILREDVEATDRQLVELAAVARSRNHLIIDSHPVTKERYGFRITPFDRASLTAINPDAIVVLYADPRVIIDRISKNSGGRPSVSEFETLIHETLQQSIAIDYSLMVPAPIYFLDSGRPLDEVVDDFLGLFGF